MSAWQYGDVVQAGNGQVYFVIERDDTIRDEPGWESYRVQPIRGDDVWTTFGNPIRATVNAAGDGYWKVLERPK